LIDNYNLDFGIVKLLTHYGFEIDFDYDIIEILFDVDLSRTLLYS